MLAEGHRLTPAGGVIHRLDGPFALVAVVLFLAPAIAFPILFAGAGLVPVGAEPAAGPPDPAARHRIAKSAAWRTGAFDADRRLEHIVWDGVRRALRLETAETEQAEDERPGVSAAARAEARRGTADAEREVARLEERLRTIKAAADAVEFTVDPNGTRARPPAGTTRWTDPLQDAELPAAEVTALRDHL